MDTTVCTICKRQVNKTDIVYCDDDDCNAKMCKSCIDQDKTCLHMIKCLKCGTLTYIRDIDDDGLCYGC